MDGIKFDFNDISLYTKNDFEWRRFVSVDILYCYYLLLTYTLAGKLNNIIQLQQNN